MIEEIALGWLPRIRTLRERRSVETGHEHADVYHQTYEFIDESNYSLYHYTEDSEDAHVHVHTVSVAIVVAIWLVITALLLTLAVAKERSLRSSSLGMILLNLCANNLLYVVITVGWYIEYELHRTSGKGAALCHFRWIMSGTLEVSFSLLLILLNAERLLQLLAPRKHAERRTRPVFYVLASGSWLLALCLSAVQMYAATGGIYYHDDSGVCYSRGRFAEVVMRSTLHYHLPALCLTCLTAVFIFLKISPCKISLQRDLETEIPAEETIHYDPWYRKSAIFVTIATNITFILLWFPETYFYIKGNLFILTWAEIKAFIGCVYLMVAGKGLVVLLFTFGVKDTRDAILFRKRSDDEQELLDMEDVQDSSDV